MSLAQRLDRMRSGFEAKAPEAVLEVMHRSTRDLTASGIQARAISEGQEAPDFRLEGTTKPEVELSELRSSGPVVLTFFRGHW